MYPLHCAIVTYTLIYAFLKKRSRTKAASAVKTAAKDVVDVESASVPDGVELEDLVKEWQASRCVAPQALFELSHKPWL